MLQLLQVHHQPKECTKARLKSEFGQPNILGNPICRITKNDKNEMDDVIVNGNYLLEFWISFVRDPVLDILYVGAS